MGPRIVHDMARNISVISYESRPTERSPDGRIWEQVQSGPPIYRLSSLSGDRDGAASDILDKDAIFDFSDKPVQVVLNLGDQKFNQACAGQILEGLQKKGWKIGPSQYTWYVTAKILNSSGILKVDGGGEFTIPFISYSWWLVDRGNRAVIKTENHYRLHPREVQVLHRQYQYPTATAWHSSRRRNCR